VLLGHAVKEVLADEEILELEDPVEQTDGLPDAELISVELTVTV
jgi:hypothetical protein